jgi:hypothetical protein
MLPRKSSIGSVPRSVEESASAPQPGAGPSSVSLAGLGIAGLSRRRVGWAVTALVTVWIAISFAGQASEAARAGERVVREQATNDALVSRVEALRDELRLVQTKRWMMQQARAYGLGSRVEHPFEMAADAPSLAPDAPGSRDRRLGSVPERLSPLDAWLDALFGPGD